MRAAKLRFVPGHVFHQHFRAHLLAFVLVMLLATGAGAQTGDRIHRIYLCIDVSDSMKRGMLADLLERLDGALRDAPSAQWMRDVRVVYFAGRSTGIYRWHEVRLADQVRHAEQLNAATDTTRFDRLFRALHDDLSRPSGDYAVGDSGERIIPQKTTLLIFSDGINSASRGCNKAREELHDLPRLGTIFRGADRSSIAQTRVILFQFVGRPSCGIAAKDVLKRWRMRARETDRDDSSEEVMLDSIAVDYDKHGTWLEAENILNQVLLDRDRIRIARVQAERNGNEISVRIEFDTNRTALPLMYAAVQNERGEPLECESFHPQPEELAKSATNLLARKVQPEARYWGALPKDRPRPPPLAFEDRNPLASSVRVIIDGERAALLSLEGRATQPVKLEEGPQPRPVAYVTYPTLLTFADAERRGIPVDLTFENVPSRSVNVSFRRCGTRGGVDLEQRFPMDTYYKFSPEVPLTFRLFPLDPISYFATTCVDANTGTALIEFRFGTQALAGELPRDGAVYRVAALLIGSGSLISVSRLLLYLYVVWVFSGILLASDLAFRQWEKRRKRLGATVVLFWGASIVVVVLLAKPRTTGSFLVMLTLCWIGWSLILLLLIPYLRGGHKGTEGQAAKLPSPIRWVQVAWVLLSICLAIVIGVLTWSARMPFWVFIAGLPAIAVAVCLVLCVLVNLSSPFRPTGPFLLVCATVVSFLSQATPSNWFLLFLMAAAIGIWQFRKEWRRRSRRVTAGRAEENRERSSVLYALYPPWAIGTLMSVVLGGYFWLRVSPGLEPVAFNMVRDSLTITDRRTTPGRLCPLHQATRRGKPTADIYDTSPPAAGDAPGTIEDALGGSTVRHIRRRESNSEDSNRYVVECLVGSRTELYLASLRAGSSELRKKPVSLQLSGSQPDWYEQRKRLVFQIPSKGHTEQTADKRQTEQTADIWMADTDHQPAAALFNVTAEREHKMFDSPSVWSQKDLVFYLEKGSEPRIHVARLHTSLLPFDWLSFDGGDYQVVAEKGQDSGVADEDWNKEDLMLSVCTRGHGDAAILTFLPGARIGQTTRVPHYYQGALSTVGFPVWVSRVSLLTGICALMGALMGLLFVLRLKPPGKQEAVSATAAKS
jgi:hypothetical protein